MVLACDGIWDCVSNQEAATFIRKEIINNMPLKEICEKLMEHCLSDNTSSNAGLGCDNMTIEIVAFLNGKSLKEWYAHIRGGPIAKQDNQSTSEHQVSTELSSESRQYSKDELEQAPDLTSSLLQASSNDNKKESE
jgi:protein phosphatase 2C family protein 2/3